MAGCGTKEKVAGRRRRRRVNVRRQVTAGLDTTGTNALISVTDNNAMETKPTDASLKDPERLSQTKDSHPNIGP